MEEFLEIEEKENRKFQSDTLGRLFSIIFKHHWPLVFGIFMVLVSTAATLVEPYILGKTIDEAIIPKRLDKLHSLTLLFLAVTGLRVVSLAKQGYFFEQLGQRVTQDLRMMLFSHLQRLSVSTHDKNPSGRLLTRVTNDIAALNEMFSAGFLSMICNVFLVVGIFIGLMIMNFRLGLIACSVFPPLILICVIFSKRLKIAYRQSRSRLSALNSFLAENLSGMKIVHLFNRQRVHLDRFRRFNHWYADAQVGSIRIFALFQPTITIASGISVALIIWFGGQAAYQGDIKLGILVAYFTYVLSVFQPMREIADKWNTFLSGTASAERIFSILNWDTELEKDAIANSVVPLSHLRGLIQFENVWFAYEDENWVLSDFSLQVFPGQKIGVVGHTGAGKTTLISLLMRFYEPQRGRILLDGVDLRLYDKRALRASIGIVQQDVFLFSGTFEENIAFQKSEVHSKRVQEILSAMGYQDRFQTRCGEVFQERGSNFSMGERQVIAFARAFAVDPKVWILDEATANMDSETEVLLQKSLDGACTGKTTLLIAHRLATVKKADQIIVLHQGHLAEKGTHEELIRKKGLYSRLHQYQDQFQSHVV